MTAADINALREGPEGPPHNPPPPPIPARLLFSLTKCPHCGWVGSSEQCPVEPGDDDSDIWCPVCHSRGCESDPTFSDGSEHGEAVYQRIVKAEADLAAARAEIEGLTKERDEADRRAGAAERTAEHDRDTTRRRNGWLSNAKAEAGYQDNVSFDRVWAETLDKAKSADRLATENAALRDVIGMALAEIAFAVADERDGSATDATRRVRYAGIRDALRGVGSPALRAALTTAPAGAPAEQREGTR